MDFVFAKSISGKMIENDSEIVFNAPIQWISFFGRGFHFSFDVSDRSAEPPRRAAAYNEVIAGATHEGSSTTRVRPVAPQEAAPGARRQGGKSCASVFLSENFKREKKRKKFREEQKRHEVPARGVDHDGAFYPPVFFRPARSTR